MGYSTLYSDMSGGLSVLSDVYKTEVYELAEYINRQSERALIPRNSITKPPSAELAPNQKDEDSLPPYPDLDEILRRYIDGRLDVGAITKETGYDPSFVISILQVVDRNEFKRKQAAPGLRVGRNATKSLRRKSSRPELTVIPITL